MTDPAVRGERLLATSAGELSLRAVATMLRDASPGFADRLPWTEKKGGVSGAAGPRSGAAEKPAASSADRAPGARRNARGA